jgi:hypothetical protein
VYNLSVLLWSSSIDSDLNDEDQIEEVNLEHDSSESLTCMNEYRHERSTAATLIVVGVL